MKIEYTKPRVHYLTISGKYLTPNHGTFVQSSGAINGPLTTTTITDPVITTEEKELALNFTVQSVSGTSPTLDIYLDVLDPVEPANSNYNTKQNNPVASIKLDPIQITSSVENIRVVISNGIASSIQNSSTTVLTNLNVPMRWQVRFVIAGASPSYSVLATYEAR